MNRTIDGYYYPTSREVEAYTMPPITKRYATGQLGSLVCFTDADAGFRFAYSILTSIPEESRKRRAISNFNHLRDLAQRRAA